MLLTELVEAITTYLNSSPEKWTEDLDIRAKAELDPEVCVLPTLGVYIVPGLVQFNREESPGRGMKVLSLYETLFVTVIISQKFNDRPNSDGVTTWEEGKKLVDLRQRVEEYIVGYKNDKLVLTDIESTPLDELEMDNRNFVGMTSFGYQANGCVTQHALPYSSTASNGSTGLQETMVSTRQQLLSARRRGRS